MGIDKQQATPYSRVLDLRKVQGVLRGFRLLKDRRVVMQIELIEAALRRCETVSKELDIPPHSERMKGLLEREETLKPYVDRYPGDPHIALAIARGDVAHYRSLREANWSNFSANPFLKSIGIPVILILFTAFLGQYIGTVLQNKAFHRQRVFELKRDRLVQGQERSVDLYNDLVRLQSSLSVRESEGTITFSDLADVRGYSGRIEKLRAISEGLIDNQSATKTLGAAAEELSKYASCLKLGRPDKNAPTCSHRFNLNKYNDIIYMFSDALVSFMSDSSTP